MKHVYPSKVLISGGKPAGGVASYAEALGQGFAAHGLPVEVVSPASIVRCPRELRDPAVLKILSLGAVFAAPVARRAICMAHGFPCAAHQGWTRTLAILGSYRLANACRGAQLLAVSDYSALHLRSIFNLRVDAVVRNPVLPLFLEDAAQPGAMREAITYVGRLHRSKNIHKVLPAMRDVLDENDGLRAWIVGDGPMRETLEKMAGGDRRIEFLGMLSPVQVREKLRRSRVFVSANPTEPFGIVYLEALSQGCAVAMPASGGGLEIAPELIGSQIQLFAASADRASVASALRRALCASPAIPPLASYSAGEVAKAYLAADARFNAHGIFCPEVDSDGCQ
jgi:glycosyltransferase involved in cell wall biosynthesis